MRLFFSQITVCWRAPLMCVCVLHLNLQQKITPAVERLLFLLHYFKNKTIECKQKQNYDSHRHALKRKKKRCAFQLLNILRKITIRSAEHTLTHKGEWERRAGVREKEKRKPFFVIFSRVLHGLGTYWTLEPMSWRLGSTKTFQRSQGVPLLR